MRNKTAIVCLQICVLLALANALSSGDTYGDMVASKLPAPVESGGGFGNDLSPEWKRRRDAIERDQRLISAYDINLFHEALFSIVERAISNKLHVSYEGIVVNSVANEQGIREVGSIGSPLEWTIYDSRREGIVSIWLSTKKMPESMRRLECGKKAIFVNLGWIRDKGTSDTKFSQLGNMSIDMLMEKTDQYIEKRSKDDR